jgi:hypothetical protein
VAVAVHLALMVWLLVVLVVEGLVFGVVRFPQAQQEPQTLEGVVVAGQVERLTFQTTAHPQAALES